jgi:hypothetical protein
MYKAIFLLLDIDEVYLQENYFNQDVLHKSVSVSLSVCLVLWGFKEPIAALWPLPTIMPVSSILELPPDDRDVTLSILNRLKCAYTHCNYSQILILFIAAAV